MHSFNNESIIFDMNKFGTFHHSLLNDVLIKERKKRKQIGQKVVECAIMKWLLKGKPNIYLRYKYILKRNEKYLPNITYYFQTIDFSNVWFTYNTYAVHLKRINGTLVFSGFIYVQCTTYKLFTLNSVTIYCRQK